MVFYVWLFGWVAFVFAAGIALSFVPAYQRRTLSRIGRRIGLGVPADLDSSFRRRVGSRVRWSSARGLLGMIVVTCVAAAVPGLQRHVESSLIVAAYAALAVTAVGSSAGVVCSALRGGIRTGGDRPRVARLRVTRPSDYLAPLPRRLAFVELGLAVVTLAILIMAPHSSSSHGVVALPSVALVILCGVSIVTYPFAARRIIDRGRESTSTDEMVWDDALRAEALRDLIVAPVQALAFGMFYGVIWLGSGTGEWALVPAFAGLACCAVFAIALRNNRDWFLRRLWSGARRRTDDEEAERLATVAHT